MSIDREEVLRIARLARLHIDPAEADALAQDLARIVGHIDALRQVELGPETESLTYFGADVLRDDRTALCLKPDEALSNAPQGDGTFFLVPKVVEKEDVEGGAGGRSVAEYPPDNSGAGGQSAAESPLNNLRAGGHA